MSYYLYIVTNFSNTTLYIGVTNNLLRRISEHKQGVVDSFSKKYKTSKLIYYEEYKQINEAIKREKQLKNWHRDWKMNLIKEKNPKLIDLLKYYKDAEINSA